MGELVEEMMGNSNLLPVEYKTADVILSTLHNRKEEDHVRINQELVQRLLSNEEVGWLVDW